MTVQNPDSLATGSKPGLKKVLFLCTQNACRSQMAELWGRHIFAGKWSVASAGTNPGEPNPRMLQVMTEAGVSTLGATSTSVAQYQNLEWDLVVTLCDHADQHCPKLSRAKRRIHVPFPDPAAAEGEEAEILRSFRQVRDQIRDFIENLDLGSSPCPPHTTLPNA
jgi:arsenate reductase (thioredoxin)